MESEKDSNVNLFEENALTYLASIVTHSNDAIIGKTLEGQVISWNPAAERLYGYTAREIIGKSVKLIYPIELEAEMVTILKSVSEGKRIESYETKRIHKDGSHIDVSITISPIKDKNNKIVGASDVTRNISEKKKQERHKNFLSEVDNVLSSSLDYNVTLQSVANLAVAQIADWCAIDLIDETGKLKLVTVAHIDPKKASWAKSLREELSPKMDETQGVGKVLKTGKPEFFHYLSDEVLKRLVKNSKQLKLVQDIGIRSVMIVPLTVRKKTLGAITFVSSTKEKLFDESDLNLAEQMAERAAYAVDNAILFKQTQDELEERKKIESALRISEFKFRKLIESNLIGVMVTDLRGRVFETNKTMLNLLGYTESEMNEGRINWNELTPEKWNEDDALAIEQVLNYGEAPSREKEYFRRDGSTIPVLVGTTLLDKEQETCLTFVLDISHQKEIERRKDDFISVASHELKTPVTSIKVFTQLLAKRLNQKADEQTIALIGKMDGQLNKLINLISDLLDVSRIQSGKMAFRPEEFCINELVSETIEALKDMTAHNIEFKRAPSAEVYADKERIGQVVTNFLTNAIKYSPPEKKIIVSVTKMDSQIKVSVQDFGIGISKEEQQKIFDRFYQAGNSKVSTFPGLGMGLFISAEIIRKHQGKIGVESKSGRGSHFFFTIPLRASLIGGE